MKYAVIGLLVLATLAHSATVKIGRVYGCENVVCPDLDCEFGPEFNSSLSCRHFCQCNKGQPVLKECPDGLHYNALINECDTPEAAGCSMSGETEAPPSNGCELVTRCPQINGEFAVHLPNPVDCGSFCKCDWGKPVYFKCPPGLHFNPELQVCDWPSEAGCEGGSGGNPTTTPGSGNPTTPNNNPTTPNGITPTTQKPDDDTPAPPTGCEDVACPPTNEGNVTLLPNPNDCGSFCKCNWGQGVYFKCPAGLHFNPVKQICDWPSQAGCEGPVLTTPKPTVGIPTVKPTTNSPTSQPTTPSVPDDETPPAPSTTTTAGPPNGCELVRCPPLNGEIALHLPNPLDCGSFCKCDWGKPVYFKCPPGLHFNAQLQVCDWPSEAGCEGGSGGNPTTTPGSGNPTTTTPGAGNPTTTTPGAGNPTTTTPGSGNPTTTTPGAGNPTTTTPGAGNPTTTTPGAGNPTTTTPGAGNPTTTPAGNDDPPTEPAPPTGCELVRCPPLNGELALHLPNPLDCGSFCKCDWGTAVYFKCPDGLHFNAELQVCDWPSEAGCEGGSGGNPTTTPGSGNSTTTTPGAGNPTTTTPGAGNPTTTPAGNDDPPTEPAPPTGCELVRCPPLNGELALHLPNPLDCGSFCKCDWGTAVYFKCPDGLHFNAEKQVCDWPSEAGCEGGSGGNPTTSPGSGNPTTTTPGAGNPTTTTPGAGNPTTTTPGAGNPTTTTPGAVNPTITTPGAGNPTTTPAGNDDPPTEPAPPTGCELVRCPPLNGELALHLPNPLDCGSFCKCDWGTAVYFKCPDGLHFNAELQVCDWPSEAGCEGGSGGNPTTTPGSGNSTTTTPGAGNPTTTKPGAVNPTITTPAGNDDPPTEPAPPTGCELVRCPPLNGELALHLPNPLDCGSFCKCDWGTAVYFKCPDGLHFNAEKQVCDWPSEAGCEGGSGGNPTTTPGSVNPTTTTPGAGNPTTTKPGAVNPTITTPAGNDDPPTEPAPPTGCELVRCPPLNGELALHLPNPLDCGSFCKCDWGTAVYFKCPDGLHFNAEKQVCDWPAAAGCNGPVVTNPTNKPTTTTVSSGNDVTPSEPPTEAPQPNGCEFVRCPSLNGEFALHLPNPLECESFCKCDWGVAVYFRCPDGLHFNKQKQVCDWPQAAKCELENLRQAADEIVENKDESTGCEVVRCPPLNGENLLNIPNPLDCGSYCRCDWGTPVYMKCPDGLHFNKESQICEWPYYAGCESSTYKELAVKTAKLEPVLKYILYEDN